jgi:hypothetical protein
MENSLSVIDYARGPLTAAPTQRCPTGAIVWIDESGGLVKGHAAKKIVRWGDRHEAPS